MDHPQRIDALPGLGGQVGIGACQTALAARDRNLVRVLAEAFELDLPTAVTMHEDLRANRSCRAVFDALAAGLQAYLREQGTRTS